MGDGRAIKQLKRGDVKLGTGTKKKSGMSPFQKMLMGKKK
jgi:hypothetical protein